MPNINLFLNYNGNAEEAFNLYKSVFGGDFLYIKRFKDIAAPDFEIPKTELNKIMNIALPIGNMILMANDVPDAMGRVSENENRTKISVSVDSRAQADQYFKGLSQGGVIEMPMAESPWRSYFGMFRDRFGIEWMIEFNLNND